jgi:hypothetical protein
MSQENQTIKLIKHQSLMVRMPWEYPNISDHFMVGGYSCIHGDSLLNTPSGNVPISDFKGGPIYSWDGKSIVEAIAFPPEKYPKTAIYKVILRNGSSIKCTIDHKFMSNGLWDKLASFSYGQSLLSSGAFRLPSNSAHDLLSLQRDERHYSHTPVDCRDDCFACSHPYGGLPRLEANIGQEPFPLQAGAREHTLNNSHKGVYSPSKEHSRVCQEFGHHANSHFYVRSVHPALAVAGYSLSEVSELPSEIFRLSEPFRESTTPVGIVREAFELRNLESLLAYYSPIESIEYVGDFEYYDLHIPFYECYWAEGILNHNCGKTSGLNYCITDVVSKYWKYPIEIGLFSPTLTFMKKTLITQMEKLFIQSKTRYSYNKQENIIKIGNLKLVLIPIDQPKNIYGHNLCASYVDEIDELPQDVAMEAYRAVSERTRIDFPDGKKPFSMFATTAQGYRGTYQVIEQLKEAGTGYTHVRGLTKDNTAGVSEDYYKKMYALYDENERLAFLEGRFVNLTAGRVYPDYDESTCMIPDFPIEPNEAIYIGQDLNTGFSKAVAFVIRGNVIYAVKEWSFKAIGHAPRIMRETFPMNHIYWLPDASSKEIIAGYQADIRQNDIELRMGSINPPVLERIFIINKLFGLKRLKVFRSLKQWPMALKTRQYNDKGDPEKGNGEFDPSHVADSSEYACWRIVSMLKEFFDLWGMTKSGRADK